VNQDAPYRGAIHVIRGDRWPVLMSVPHAGRDYDSELIARSRLGQAALEKLEDPLVDRLIAGALTLGVGAVIANAPRAAIDCNRAEDELDPRAIAGRTGVAPTARARAGLGLIPTRLAEVGDLWRAPISEATFNSRLAEIHRAFHDAIDAELAALSRLWRDVVLIDCHSMPPRPPGEADVVIGDRHGTSSAPWVTEAAVEIAQRLGFKVARNIPFAGGHIVERHGKPSRGRHAVQIEVDRSRYCLRDARSPRPGFERVSHLFDALARELGELTSGRRWPDAAE